MLTYSLKIEKIQQETSDAITICFKQPGLKKIKYSAGQYLTLIFKINGRRYIRPYSFSSAPGFDNTLNVTVKRVHGGIVSNHILDKLNVGDIIEVLEPMGGFTLEKISDSISNKHIILWGSGSGITPLMSISKFALQYDNYNHITLVYGNRNHETTIFAEQIKELQKKYPQRFSVWHFHTRAFVNDANPNIIQGRIDPQKVLEVMHCEGDLLDTVHYICGPAGLKESVKKVLSGIGVPAENIFSEDFEAIRDPKELEDIFTQNVLLTVNNQLSNIEITKGKSILEAGLDAMIDLSYSCQTGSCLLCKATLISGKVKTIGVTSSNELSTHECLMCCSFPLTNDVELLVAN